MHRAFSLLLFSPLALTIELRAADDIVDLARDAVDLKLLSSQARELRVAHDEGAGIRGLLTSDRVGRCASRGHRDADDEGVRPRRELQRLRGMPEIEVLMHRRACGWREVDLEGCRLSLL